MPVYDPGILESGSVASIRLCHELDRSAINPLQKYMDPTVFVGPDDPAIGGAASHSDAGFRGMVMTAWVVGLLILTVMIIGGFIA